MLKNDRLSDNTKAPAKELLELTKEEWIWPLAFMLSMSMIGLHFPLGHLLVPVILLNRFRKDRYDFIIMLTLFFGGYSLATPSDVGFYYIPYLTIFGILCLFIFKKPPLLKKLIIAFAAYAVTLLGFAIISDESLIIQLHGITTYLSIVFFIYPLMAFSGEEFDIKVFFKHLFPYVVIFCVYYWIDCLILNGHFFLPRDASAIFYGHLSTFYDPIIYPFAMAFPRRWPLGLYILILCVFPIVKYYKLKPIHWILIFVSLAISRTFTFILGLALIYFFVKGLGKNLLKYALISVVTFVALYFIDSAIPYQVVHEGGKISSALRIKSSIDQIIDIQAIEDDEDLADVGSGRMGQILPKMMLLYSMDKEWVGFGFLDRQLTKNNKYIIENEYADPENAVEVATGVEVIPVQIILNIGYLGLILHTLFFFYTWWVVRRLKYSVYYLSVMLGFIIIGISGFSGLIGIHGLYMTALSLAVVILANKREIGFSLPPKPAELQE